MGTLLFESLDVGHRLFIPQHGTGIVLIAGGDNDDREMLVDQRERAVLGFTGGITFGVNVRDFFEL